MSFKFAPHWAIKSARDLMSNELVEADNREVWDSVNQLVRNAEEKLRTPVSTQDVDYQTAVSTLDKLELEMVRATPERLITIGQELSAFFYDAFVAKFDFWLVFGLLAQLLFAGRFLVQWIASERAGKSVVPFAFWVFSMGGGLMTLVYGIVRREPVIIFGQAVAMIIYVRNIMLIFRERGRAKSGRTE